MLDHSSRRPRGPAGSSGWRAYVIGDVHGRFDLLKQLLEAIHEDLRRHPPNKALLVFVGDLIDRGPQSAEVIEHLRNYRRDSVKTMFLLGNHEEVLLRILRGDAALISKWCSFGGSQCLASYGLDGRELERLNQMDAVEVIRKTIPREHIAFLESFADTCRFGDFLFVHAGIRPGIEIDQQRQKDLRWIREPFLFDETDHGFVVVHGHTISPEVTVHPNRIGIDTGAYRTGVLTALLIEGTSIRIIDTRSTQDDESTGCKVAASVDAG
jgi:serine/threonine protein phosphatase 1